MKVLAVLAATIGAVAASDFPSWHLYCGSSCSGGTLINSGTLDSNPITSCTSLGATYDYCYLQNDSDSPLYRATISSSEQCTLSSEEHIIESGQCTAAGQWQYYQIYYNA